MIRWLARQRRPFSPAMGSLGIAPDIVTAIEEDVCLVGGRGPRPAPPTSRVPGARARACRCSAMASRARCSGGLRWQHPCFHAAGRSQRDRAALERFRRSRRASRRSRHRQWRSHGRGDSGRDRGAASIRDAVVIAGDSHAGTHERSAHRSKSSPAVSERQQRRSIRNDNSNGSSIRHDDPPAALSPVIVATTRNTR